MPFLGQSEIPCGIKRIVLIECFICLNTGSVRRESAIPIGLILFTNKMDFITENILLIITFIGSAILLAFPSLSKSRNAGLNPADVVIKVNDKNAQLVDVRTPSEFSKGTLAGSVNIPAADLIAKLDTLDKNRPVILGLPKWQKSTAGTETVQGERLFRGIHT